MIYRKAEVNDIIRVQSLQDKYLYSTLTETERKKGFVTTPFTEYQIQNAISQDGLFIAVNKNEVVVAYVFSGSWSYFSEWPIFPYMISKFLGNTYCGITISDQNTFQYGPVCINESYRGREILPSLFEIMRITNSKKYPVGLTFINSINTHSLHAHTRKLALEVIGDFSLNNHNFHVLAFDTSKSVL